MTGDEEAERLYWEERFYSAEMDRWYCQKDGHALVDGVRCYCGDVDMSAPQPPDDGVVW